MSETGDWLKRLLGNVMMAVGILIAGLSGGCSLFAGLAGIATLFGSWSLADKLQFLASGAGMVLVVGGIPFVIGVGLFFGGRRLVRSTDGPDF